MNENTYQTAQNPFCALLGDEQGLEVTRRLSESLNRFYAAMGSIGQKQDGLDHPEPDEEQTATRPGYYRKGGLECFDVIRCMVDGLPPFEAYLMGSALNYLFRYKDKGDPELDLLKARVYIDRLVAENEQR